MIGRTYVASFGCASAFAVAVAIVPVRGAQVPESPTRVSQRVGVDDLVSFDKDVRPIFQACETCHGELQMSGLDLRTRDGALKGGDHGAAIVPGSADQSRLYRR